MSLNWCCTDTDHCWVYGVRVLVGSGFDALIADSERLRTDLGRSGNGFGISAVGMPWFTLGLLRVLRVSTYEKGQLPLAACGDCEVASKTSKRIP